MRGWRSVGAIVVAMVLAGASAAHASAWQIKATPAVDAASNSQLSGVSCPRARMCMAVGGAQIAGVSAPLAEVWNGRWRVAPIPASAGTGTLSGVSCPSATFCIAVGHNQSASGMSPLILRWTRGTWSVTRGPALSGELSGVSCPTRRACLAVGSAGSSAGGVTSALAERLDGTHWRLLTPVSPGPTFTAFTSVSCPRVGVCQAVGSSDATGPLAEGFDRGTWTVEAIGGGNGTEQLTGVSCGSAATCMSVGSELAGRDTLAVGLLWDGTAWSFTDPVEPAPPPAPIFPSFYDVFAAVSCPVSTSCVAVGTSDYNADYFEVPLGEVWNGAGWSENEPVIPPHSTTSTLTGVACPRVLVCMAVGSVDGRPLAERLVPGG